MDANHDLTGVLGHVDVHDLRRATSYERAVLLRVVVRGS